MLYYLCINTMKKYRQHDQVAPSQAMKFFFNIKHYAQKIRSQVFRLELHSNQERKAWSFFLISVTIEDFKSLLLLRIFFKIIIRMWKRCGWFCRSSRMEEKKQKKSGGLCRFGRMVGKKKQKILWWWDSRWREWCYTWTS